MPKRKLIAALSLLCPVSADYATLIREQEVYAFKSIKKHMPMAMPGKDADELCFICNGLLKLFRYNDRGEQHIYDFFTENIFMMLPAEFYDSASNQLYYVTALSDCDILSISRSEMNKLYLKFAESKIHTDRIRSRIELRQRAHVNLLLSDPSERYECFLKSSPNVVRLLSDDDLCAYLGIGQRTLTRSKQVRLNTNKARK
ncbi:MAG TPA: cyclic nucleotide-binding domain-containing protein [Pedobacter sp.]|nr:cyclic nucleotide-binding domain-containing protein [Pedobacter sp.]